jgi:hypothetical protein
MLPVSRHNLPLANECIQHLLDNCDLNIIVIDENGNDAEYINHDRIKFIHNQTNVRPGLCKLWNQCIKECPTEYPILVAWRCRPSRADFELMKEKIEQGFACVLFPDLHFFTFSKYLTTKIGMFDEGYQSGQYEDLDWMHRLYFADYAIYSGHVVNQVSYPTCWGDGSTNRAYYETKFIEARPHGLIQLKEETNIEDRLLYVNKYIERNYLPFNQSILTYPLDFWYTDLFRDKEKRC